MSLNISDMYQTNTRTSRSTSSPSLSCSHAISVAP